MSSNNFLDTVERISVIVACLIERDDKYLVVVEEQEGRIVHGFPAGHVDLGESLETAAVREVKEETGYNVRLGSQIALFHESAAQSVKHIYSGEIIGGSEQAQAGEIMEIVWKTYEEILALESEGKLRAPWVGESIEIHKKIRQGS